MLECVTTDCTLTSSGSLFLEQAAESFDFFLYTVSLIKQKVQSLLLKYSVVNQRVLSLHLLMVEDQVLLILERRTETW